MTKIITIVTLILVNSIQFNIVQAVFQTSA